MNQREKNSRRGVVGPRGHNHSKTLLRVISGKREIAGGLFIGRVIGLLLCCFFDLEKKKKKRKKKKKN